MITCCRCYVLLAVSLLLISCAAPFPFITAQLQSETLDLKALCDQQKIVSQERTIADSLVAQAELLLDKKKNEPAYALLDRAGLFYRIALSNTSINAKTAEKQAREQALAKTREDVAAYKQVLSQLKTMEQQ